MGGGQVFTIGSEGHERDKKHIASQMPFVISNGIMIRVLSLKLLITWTTDHLGGDTLAYQMRMADGKLPFTSLDKLEDSEGSFAQRR